MSQAGHPATASDGLARLRIGRGVVAFPFELAFVAELVDSVSDTRDGGGQIDATGAVP
jgi:hypothetical protein